jgi:hypothetical protein
MKMQIKSHIRSFRSDVEMDERKRRLFDSEMEQMKSEANFKRGLKGRV